MKFKGESDEYRKLRDQLLSRIALKDQRNASRFFAGNCPWARGRN